MTLNQSIAAKNRTIPRKGLFEKGHIGYKAMLGKPKTVQQIALHKAKMIGKKQSIESNIKRSNTMKSIGHTYPRSIGAANASWKGGITPLNEKIRKSSPYYRWVYSVFERDNFICKNCSQRGGNLEAHHLKPFSIIIKENSIRSLDEAFSCKELWNIDNGQTLCKKCHIETDTYGPKINKLYGRSRKTDIHQDSDTIRA